MTISPTILSHSPRVIDSSASAAVSWNPAAAMNLPAPPLHLTLHLSRLSDDDAAVLRRHARNVGGVAEISPAGRADMADGHSAIVAATEEQYDRLCGILDRLAPRVCEAIRTTIECYQIGRASCRETV